MTGSAWILIGVIIFLFVLYITVRIRDTEEDSDFIYWEDFMSDWIIDKKSKKGYYYNHTPGCYVILIFDKKVRNNNFSNYENVYVGQSIWVENRVHNHFIGKGNGDVYADVKYGKKVYVKIIYCKREEMNDIEVSLIDKYDATSSYNGTKGGSTDWIEKKKRSNS